MKNIAINLILFVILLMISFKNQAMFTKLVRSSKEIRYPEKFYALENDASIIIRAQRVQTFLDHELVDNELYSDELEVQYMLKCGDRQKNSYPRVSLHHFREISEREYNDYKKYYFDPEFSLKDFIKDSLVVIKDSISERSCAPLFCFLYIKYVGEKNILNHMASFLGSAGHND